MENMANFRYDQSRRNKGQECYRKANDRKLSLK
jgi:hypothetical protein